MSGADRTFVSGETSGTCENSAVEYGCARSEDASVIASASIAKSGIDPQIIRSQWAARGLNRAIPKVDKAERANDAETATTGSSAIIPNTQAPKAARPVLRRFERKESCSAAAITNARTAETGIPASAR